MEYGRWLCDPAPLVDAMYDLMQKVGTDRLFIDDVIDVIENADVKEIASQDGCDYCNGTVFTDKPFTVITPREIERSVIFNFCPCCGKKLDLEG